MVDPAYVAKNWLPVPVFCNRYRNETKWNVIRCNIQQTKQEVHVTCFRWYCRLFQGPHHRAEIYAHTYWNPCKHKFHLASNPSMDRSSENNIPDSCITNGINVNGASFTLPPSILLRTNSNLYGHPLFGESYGFGRRIDVHQMTNLKDILDSAIRIADEVCIDVNSNATVAQSSVAMTTASAPTGTCQSSTDTPPPIDQDVVDLPENKNWYHHRSSACNFVVTIPDFAKGQPEFWKNRIYTLIMIYIWLKLLK